MDFRDEPPGMVPSSQPEESLGVGFERQYEGLKAFQDQLGKYGDDLQKLQARCARLKRECTALQADKAAQEREYAAKEGEMGNLTRAIEGLRGERDALQLELAAMCEEERVWRAADQAGLHELDRAGRLARQLWLRSEEVARLQERLASIGDEHEEKLRSEAHVAAELRLRIAKLERRLRDSHAPTSAPTHDAEKIADLDHRNAVLREELLLARRHHEDAQAALQEQGKAQGQLTTRIERLEEEKRAALEELRVVKQEKRAAQEACAALKKQAEGTKGKQTNDETISPNVSTRSHTSAPSTPTKSQPIDEAQLAEVSPQSKDKAFHHLMNQNALLKKQLDRERTKRAADIKHFKEYKAVQDERKALKQKRREERGRIDASSRSANATPVSSSVPPPSDPPAPITEEPRPQLEPAAAPSEPARHAPPPSAEERNTGPSAAPPPPPEQPAQVSSQPREESQPNRVRSASTSRISAPAVAKEEHNTPLRRTTTGVPTPKTTPRTLARQPTRVTPWLGGKSDSSKSARKMTRAGSFGSDEEDGGAATTPSARPLVRDRTGTTSLLKAALQRTAAGGGQGDAGAGGGGAAPESPGAGSSTPLSRKHSLDLEGLSLAERAAQRRRLNQMSTTEKRDFYAQYKGGGRYLRPDAVARSVADEFEIDPARNAGVAHKYHDVVRARDARRQMHGGDCECCREYYAAVGPLPRFNQGPAWKRKDTEGEEEEEDDLAEHRNRVSRHRDTWQRPPTPPDFWKIGFPSTQDVEAVNAKADEMAREREAEARREAARKDSKWRRKG